MPCDRIDLLCEDRAHEQFVLPWLKMLGIGRRRVHLTVAPKGAGSAEAFVIAQCARVITAFRAKANHQHGLGLIVMVDADTETTQGRERQLDAALTEAGKPARSLQERVCYFVPKRHVETWLRYAQGMPVDETQDVKRGHGEVDADGFQMAIQRFDAVRRSPDCGLESLSRSVSETRRLGF